MDYPQGERAVTHHAGPVRCVLSTANTAGTYHVFRRTEELEIKKFWSTIRPDQSCLASAIVRRVSGESANVITLYGQSL
jgi:hypothetical protein